MNPPSGPALPWTLLVEDEPRLQQQLHALLVECAPELTPVHLAGSAEEALALCSAGPPRVAFLDLRLPGMSGIELARRLAATTQLVLVTACEQHAVEAFEYGAVDYLLKPISRARLLQTVARLRVRSTPAAAVIEQLLGALAAPAPSYLKWITASAGKRTHFIGVDDVLCFRSDQKYTRVICADSDYLIEEPLKQLLPRLDPQQFRQVHRSAVVQLREVLLVERDDAGGGTLKFRRHPERIRISAAYLRELKGFLV